MIWIRGSSGRWHVTGAVAFDEEVEAMCGLPVLVYSVAAQPAAVGIGGLCQKCFDRWIPTEVSRRQAVSNLVHLPVN